ncbi:hypothetical protein [Desulfosporosinus youngiae]|uniref:Uncharacterized protein n=1 Tax=Desulfosporosinus youngiae DSM 17734 TaxID=768710 RepID=H5Y544_9FIRM|nr:hypothetical protein [Desulfosporosinus youngiae]EHQ90148.1 hypothetical protein DesyoDRAFT_3112 [Desulfosporosinus youngiae DSM 17734]
MVKKNFLLTTAILFVGTSFIIGSYLIGNSIQSVAMRDSDQVSIDNKVLSLSQTAKYLNMTEDEILGIIQTEKSILEKTGSFHGRMFPYFTVNSKQYFYLNEIDEWLKEVSSGRREYNTTAGWML